MSVDRYVGLRFSNMLGAAILGLFVAGCGGGGGGGGNSEANSFQTSNSSSAGISSSSSSLASSSSSVSSNSTSSSSSLSSLAAPSSLSYANPQAYSTGVAISALNPTVTGTVANYSVSPALPSGLSLNVITGRITGVPTNSSPTTSYTVSASNSSGTTTFALSITVNLSRPVVSIGYGVKQVILSWSAVSGATHYQVFKNPDGSSGYTQLGPNLTTTTYSDSVSVHLSDWLNMSYIVMACDNSGCVNSLVSNSFDSSQAVGYFKASNTGANDVFGGDVAISDDGTTLAVGAYLEASAAIGINGSQSDNSLPDSGAVYVFTKNGAVWTQQAYIKASNPDENDQFGSAVSLSGDGNTLAVGAIGEDSSASGVNGTQGNNSMPWAGAVYVFSRSGTTWSQQAYVKSSNPDSFDQFGISVALNIDGNTMVVGARGESSGATGINGSPVDNSQTYAGAAYAFIRSGSTWSQQAYIKASNTEANDQFGFAVEINGDGNTMAVGAYSEASSATGIDGTQGDNSLSAAGAVYVFTRTSGSWSQQAYVKPYNTNAFDYFGFSMALSDDGDTLAVGAFGEDSNATGVNGIQTDNSISVAGAAYVFKRSGTTWSQQAYVKASNPGIGDQFGISVTLSSDGNTLAVGAFGESSASLGVNGNQLNDSMSNAGAVYVYTRTGNSWSQRAYVKASNTDANDDFGRHVALNSIGSIMAVSAYIEDGGTSGIGGLQSDNSASAAGAVYLY